MRISLTIIKLLEGSSRMFQLFDNFHELRRGLDKQRSTVLYGTKLTKNIISHAVIINTYTTMIY